LIELYNISHGNPPRVVMLPLTTAYTLWAPIFNCAQNIIPYLAVGTFYNYFPSKIALIKAIMLEDWADQTEKIQHACANAENAESGIQSIFFHLREFAMLYQDVWNMAMHSEEVRDEMVSGRSRRQVLIQQLAGIISALLVRFGIPCEPFLPHFIAASLLAYVAEPDFDYEQIHRILIKILYGNTENKRSTL